MNAIPRIDVSALFDVAADHSTVLAELTYAVERVGFFSVVGHGISVEQFAAVRTMVEALFSVSDDDKLRQAIVRDNYRGFIPLGFFTPNRAEDPHGGRDIAPPDRYEGFKLHTEVAADDSICVASSIYGPNRWADHPSNMAEVVLDYWAACERLSNVLITASEQILDLDPGSLTRRFAHPVTNMTLLHYPPTDPVDDVFGIHPHKDTNVFTLLYPDPVGGLSVRTREGEWFEAHCEPDAVLVNTGDMLEVWSGGRFVSTPHKVVNTTGQERYAFPWFLVPSHDEVIEPLVDLQPGFNRSEGVEVGPWSLEVWRTNWSDAEPKDTKTQLGTLD